MKVAVFDTYVKKSNGDTAHFDIIVPEGRYADEEILEFGIQYLRKIGETGSQVSTKECRFCHVEEPTPQITQSIEDMGYYILEMEDIPATLPQQPTRRNLIQHLRAISEEHRFASFSGVPNEEVRRLIELVE